MRRSPGRRQRGLTLLEFTLIAIIVSVLIALALARIAGMRIHMERAAVEHNVARMREALAIQFAELVVESRLDEVPQFAGANPLERYGVTESYTGVRRLPPDNERTPGQWYFDTAIGNVVYVPRYPGALEWPDGQPRLLRWRVRPDWVDVDGDGELDRGSDRVLGIDLVRVDDARWR